MLGGGAFAMHIGVSAQQFAIGTIYGLLISGAIGTFEVFASSGPLRDWLGSLPFSASLAVRSAFYAAVIIPVLYFDLGVLIAGQTPDANQGVWTAIIFSAVFSVALNLLFSISNIIGPRTFLNLATGRYHTPVEESRFVLFVDIAGSTTLAERLGGIGIHRFLDKTFRTLTGAVVDYRGEILNYVGDEIIVTWPEEAGAIDSRPLRCFLSMRATLERLQSKFEEEFGAAPRIRGSLHFGPVIVGEIGDDLHAHLHGLITRGAKPFNAAQQQLFGAVKDVGALLGQDIAWKPSGGVCEGNNLFASGLPNVDTLGVRGGDIHSEAEHAFPESFVERAQLSALILMKLASGEIDARAIRAAMNAPWEAN